MDSKLPATFPERPRSLSSSEVSVSNTPPRRASAAHRPRSPQKPAGRPDPALFPDNGPWPESVLAKEPFDGPQPNSLSSPILQELPHGTNPSREGQQPQTKVDWQDAELGEGGANDNWLRQIGGLDEGSGHWPEAWMSFRPKDNDKESSVLAGAHVPKKPDRRLWLSLTITCSKRDLLVHWGFQVHLHVFNERYETHNPATLNLSFPSSGVPGDGESVPPLDGLKCEFLAGATAEQFATQFAGHPAFVDPKTQSSNLVLIEFDSTKAFLEADNPSSFADADLLRLSQTDSYIGPGLTDAVTAFRSAASMVGRVQIVVYMAQKQQQLRLMMNTVPAMAKGFDLVKLLRGEEEA